MQGTIDQFGEYLAKMSELARVQSGFYQLTPAEQLAETRREHAAVMLHLATPQGKIQ